MIKLGFILAGLAICNAVLAVLMPWYVVTRLGVGVETDAFFASGALPQLIFLVASFSLTQVLVPLLAPLSIGTLQLKDGRAVKGPADRMLARHVFERDETDRAPLDREPPHIGSGERAGGVPRAFLDDPQQPLPVLG